MSPDNVSSCYETQRDAHRVLAPEKMTEIHISFLLRLSRITTTGWLVVHADYLTGLWKCDAGLEFRH